MRARPPATRAARPRHGARDRRRPPRRAGAAAVEPRPRPALRLQLRRGRALRPRGRSRCSTARWTRATTRTPRPSRTSCCSSSTSGAGTWHGRSRPTPSRPSSRPASSSRSWGRSASALTLWAGARFYDRRVGLVAAAVLAVAFLPVFYAKHALNDVVTLVPVTVALVACLVVHQRGRWPEWAVAGAAIGAATATKYTAGAMLVTLLVAAGLRVLDDRGELRPRWPGSPWRPWASRPRSRCSTRSRCSNPSEAHAQVVGQSRQAGTGKLGHDDVPERSTTSARSPGAWAGCRSRPRPAAWSPACGATGAGPSCSSPSRSCSSCSSARRHASSGAGCCPRTRRCACSPGTGWSRSRGRSRPRRGGWPRS